MVFGQSLGTGMQTSGFTTVMYTLKITLVTTFDTTTKTSATEIVKANFKTP